MITKVKRNIRSATRQAFTYAYCPMKHPSYPESVAKEILLLGDAVRYSALALAIQRLETDKIQGAFAELGVFRGETSRFMHRQAPDRTLYLFDTFEGLPTRNLEVREDSRFDNTSINLVRQKVGNSPKIMFRPGYFPESAKGLEDERFALVMLDFDLYQSAIDAFRFFYSRLVPGGYFFMHDFNSEESNRGISRAAEEFMRDKPELLLEIPDQYGSAVFRKLN